MFPVKPRQPVFNPGHPLSRGLVAAYTFSEGGGAIINDRSSRDQVAFATAGTSWAASSAGSSLLTDGSAQQIIGPVPPRIGGAVQASFAAYIGRSSTTQKVGGGYGSISNANRFNFIWFTDGNIYLQVCNGNINQYNYVSLSGTGEHLVVLTFDGNRAGNDKVLAYIDGRQVTLTYNLTPPVSLPSAANLGNIWIGREIGNSFCAGTYGLFYAWARTLNAAEAMRLAVDPFVMYRQQQMLAFDVPVAPKSVPPFLRRPLRIWSRAA